MKKEFIIASTVIFCLSVLGCVKPPCFDCGKSKHSTCGKFHNSHEREGFEHCLLKAPCFAIMNKKELALTDEQESKIKELCTETKKKHIKLEADIDTVCVDLKSKLFNDELNLVEINKLIDQKYELKKQELKTVIESFAHLKQVLTAEQREKLKELKKNCKKDGCCSSCK